MFTSQDMFVFPTAISFETQISLTRALAGKLFDSAEKILELNISATKTSLEKSNLAAAQLFTVETPQDFLSLTASQIQSNIEKILAYGRQLAAISSGTQDEISRPTTSKIEGKSLEEKTKKISTPVISAQNLIDKKITVKDITTTPPIDASAKTIQAEPKVRHTTKVTPIETPAKPSLIVTPAEPAKATTKRAAAVKPTQKNVGKTASKSAPSKTPVSTKTVNKIEASKVSPKSKHTKPIPESAPAGVNWVEKKNAPHVAAKKTPKK